MSLTDPNPSTCALLTIDMQNDFSLPGAVAEIAGTSQITPNLQKVVAAFREAQRPLIHVVRLYLQDGSNVDLCRREMIQGGKRVVTPGENGADLVSPLSPHSQLRHDPNLLLKEGFQKIGGMEWLMYKSRWGAFYKTGLEKHLQSLGIDTLVIGGCNFPNCPRTTIYQASERDFKLVFVTDATSGVYEKGLEELRNIGVSMKKTEEIPAFLNSTPV